MILLTVIAGLAICWYLMRWLGHFSMRINRLVERLSPYTRKLHIWILTAPATFFYVSIFSALAYIQKTTPPHLVSVLTRMNSTNLDQLGKAPVSMLVDSALWVADRGAGLFVYVALFSTFIAWAERRYGTPRIILIGACGHVFGSLLTVLTERILIATGHAPANLDRAIDVGVSYVMVAGCGAAVLLMRRWWLAVGIVALFGLVVLPVIIDHTVWDLGHLFALSSGLIVAAITLRIRPARTTALLPAFSDSPTSASASQKEKQESDE